MVTPIKFAREMGLQTRHITGEPGENRGPRRDEIDLLFTVRASLGAVQLRVRVQLTPNLPSHYEPVQAIAVSSHFKRKLSEHWLETGNCDVLGQDVCFGDTGYLVAQDAWKAFADGEETGWQFLEDIYKAWRKP